MKKKNIFFNFIIQNSHFHPGPMQKGEDPCLSVACLYPFILCTPPTPTPPPPA